MNSSQVMLQHPAPIAASWQSFPMWCMAQEACCEAGISYRSQRSCTSLNQVVHSVRGGLYIWMSHDFTMAIMARGARKYSSGAVALYGGGLPRSPPSFSSWTTDSAACFRTSPLVEVTDLALVATTRAPDPVVAAPVRIVPTDGITTPVVPADWSDMRATRVAVLHIKDW